MTITAPSSSGLDLSTREVYVTATHAFVTATSTDNISVTLPSGATLGPDDYLPLPRVGERVQIESYGRTVAGVYLGHSDHGGGPVLTAFVLNGTSVQTTPAPVTLWDARRSVTDTITPEAAVLEVMTALAEACKGRARDAARHQEWIDDLVEDAHQWADEHDLCSRFDDFCSDHSLPTRTRDYDVRVNVSMSTRVTVTRSAGSSDDAEDAVDRDDVREALESMFGSSLLADVDFDYETDGTD